MNLYYNVLEYFALGLGLANNILENIVGGVFHHLPIGGEGNYIGV